MFGITGPFLRFQFERVFAESCSQKVVYTTFLDQFVSLVLDGYDLTVLAYGQSGSGKTHTLVGPDLPCAVNEEDFALVPRFAIQLFNQLEEQRSIKQTAFEVKVSFFGIGDDDQFHDLLPHSDSDPEGDASSCVLPFDCNTINDVVTCLERGLDMYRQCNDNDFAFLPQRHKVFEIRVKQTAMEAGFKRVRESTVRFVDFVGSELHSKGLLSLNLVVGGLGEPRTKMRTEDLMAHFENSFLTRFLRNALGGTSITVMLACISSLEKDSEQTRKTLEFASLASNIKNDPRAQVTDLPTSGDFAASGDVVDDGDDDDDSQIRSASVTHGNIGNLPPPATSQPMEDLDAPEVSISLTAENERARQQDLLSQFPPPPPGVDPFAYNYHLINILGNQWPNSQPLSALLSPPLQAAVPNFIQPPTLPGPRFP